MLLINFNFFGYWVKKNVSRGVSAPPSELPGPSRGVSTPPSELPGPSRGVSAPPSGLPGPSRGVSTPPSGRPGPSRGVSAPPSGLPGPSRGVSAPPSGRPGPSRGVSTPPSGLPGASTAGASEAVAEGSASIAGRHTEGLPPCVPEWRLLLVKLELSELHNGAAMIFADFQAEVLPLTARDTEGIDIPNRVTRELVVIGHGGDGSPRIAR